MMFMFIADGQGESSLLSSLGSSASVTTVLCIVVVTVALVLLTVMCVCSKKTASMKLQNNSTLVPENEHRITLKQLSKTEDLESQLTEANKEESDEGKLAESIPEEGGVPAAGTTQQLVLHLKEEKRPASHPSPHLPPRNPHNFHASAHPSNQSPASVSARASTPASLERTHSNCVSMQTTGNSAMSATEGAMATKDSRLPDHSWMPCRVQPDYEEMDLPEKPASANTKADECDDTNIYQDIDLNQELKTKQTAVKNIDSIEPYAEYKEDSKKSSVVKRPQLRSASLETSESEAPVGIQSTTEIPKYAKVDKARKSQETSSNSSLADHFPENGHVPHEVPSDGARPKSSEPTTNVAELYTQVLKPKGNAVLSIEGDKDLHASTSHESVNGKNSTAAGGDMVLNPCYAATMFRNCQDGAQGDHGSTQRVVVQTAEEPPYSTIGDERVNIALNPEPGYSSISEVQGGYAEILTTSQSGSAATANAAGGNNSTDQISSPREPIYDLVDAMARDETSSQST